MAERSRATRRWSWATSSRATSTATPQREVQPLTQLNGAGTTIGFVTHDMGSPNGRRVLSRFATVSSWATPGASDHGHDLARKAWRDLGRRRARTMLTSARSPSRWRAWAAGRADLDRSHHERRGPRDTQLYDIPLPVRDLNSMTKPVKSCRPFPSGHDQRPRDGLHPSARRRPPHPGAARGRRGLRPAADRRRAHHEWRHPDRRARCSPTTATPSGRRRPRRR